MGYEERMARRWLGLLVVVAATCAVRCGPATTQAPTSPVARVSEREAEETRLLALSPPASDDTPEPEPAPEGPEDPCPADCRAAIETTRVIRQKAEGVVGPGRTAAYAIAGGAYEQAWAACGWEPSVREHCPLDEVLREMGKSFRMAQRPLDAATAYLLALDSRFGPAAGGLGEGARIALRELAEEGEKAGAGQTADALAAAVYARIALGFDVIAERDADLLLRRYRDAPATMEVGLVIARRELRRGQHGRALLLLQRLPSPLVVGLTLQREALLGEALVALHRVRESEAHFRGVVAAWEAEPEGGRRRMLSEVAPIPMLDREQIADAIGASTFYVAEVDRRKAEAMRRPAFVGPRTQKALQKYMSERAAPWLRDRRRAIEAASQGYRKVLAIGSAPARWVIRAGAAVGDAWVSYVDELLGMPAPAELDTDPKLRATYDDALRSAAAPMREYARAAYRTCAEWADEHGDVEGTGARCRKWLDANPE